MHDAWSGVRIGQSHGFPNHRYCANLGHIADDETGLTYMRARYYEPSTGRFISEDPAMDGLNWFVYASNSPIARVDAYGEDDFAESTKTVYGPSEEFSRRRCSGCNDSLYDRRLGGADRNLRALDGIKTLFP